MLKKCNLGEIPCRATVCIGNAIDGRRRRTGGGAANGAGAAAPGDSLGRTCVAPSLDGAALDRLLIHCSVPNMEDIIIGSAHQRC